VQRGPKKLKIAFPKAGGEISADATGAPGAGLVWESPPRSFRIDSVLPGSRAANAGIEPGDRLVRINQTEPRNLAQVQQIFAGDNASPVFLEIDRGSRRVGILVP
jgi:membrane-associated protease RseP (regulator of RpoE activity)